MLYQIYTDNVNITYQFNITRTYKYLCIRFTTGVLLSLSTSLKESFFHILSQLYGTMVLVEPRLIMIVLKV